MEMMMKTARGCQLYQAFLAEEGQEMVEQGGAAEAAIVAEYALRVSGGGGARTHRAHVVAAPCFLRVSSSLAHPY